MSSSIHKWDSASTGPSVQAAAAHLGEVSSILFSYFVFLQYCLGVQM